MKLYDLHIIEPDGTDGIMFHFSTIAKGTEFISAFRDKCHRKFGKYLHVNTPAAVQPSNEESMMMVDFDGTDYDEWEMEFINELGYLNPSLSVIERLEFDEDKLKKFYEEKA